MAHRVEWCAEWCLKGEKKTLSRFPQSSSKLFEIIGPKRGGGSTVGFLHTEARRKIEQRWRVSFVAAGAGGGGEGKRGGGEVFMLRARALDIHIYA